jgi:DNA-binding winged helix-turn-helix (wHTH) protein
MIESLFLPPDVSGLIAALAIGLLIGLERGWNDRELPEGSRVAGLRTFTLTGLLGGVLGHLQPNFGPWPLVAAVLGLSLLLTVSYARIKTLLRRGQQREDNNIIKIADLELDLRKRRVTRAGQRIDLTAKEFALMELFMRRRGEILPRALIASQIWDMNFDSDTNVVEVAIKRLRNKVDSNFTPKLIQNIRGMGYVLEVEDE